MSELAGEKVREIIGGTQVRQKLLAAHAWRTQGTDVAVHWIPNFLPPKYKKAN